MNSKSHPKVVIIQRTFKFYRLTFIKLLKQKLEKNGIELVFVYGDDDYIMFNDAQLDWGIKIKNYELNIFGKKVYYQPALSYTKGADLVIVEQASKLLINYYLWFLNLIGLKRLAFWGHGLNFQNFNSKNFGEIVKKILTRKVSWFFAYNDLTKKILEGLNYPSQKITTVYNTIDVEGIRETINNYDNKLLQKIKNDLVIEGENICLFIGGLYKEKRLEFLFESIFIIKNAIPDFHFIIIGDGPDKSTIFNIVSKNKWIHYLGFKNEVEKVPFCLMSKLLMIPSLVGLSVIDSFVFEMPLVTTDSIGHGPEIDYLKNGINGIITKNNLEDYSAAIIDLLLHKENRLRLAEQCKKSTDKYTVVNMVNNFYDGIVTAIN